MGSWHLALFLCINFAVIICASHTNDYYSSHIPAYAVASRSTLLNSTTCKMELEIFRDAVDKQIPWSMKMLHSSGQSGKLQGNRFWTGSYYECFDSMNETPLPLSKQLIRNSNVGKELPLFKVNYFVAHVRYNSTLYNPIAVLTENQLTLGLCLPSSCSTNDISFILEGIFHDRVLFISNFYSMKFDIIEVKSLQNQWLFTDITHYIIIGVIALILLMMIIGTIYDIFVFRKYLGTNSDTATVHRPVSKDNIKPIALSIHRESTIEKILVSFSIYTNTIKLFDTNVQDEIRSIHGIRFLTMTIILLSHSYLFVAVYVDNIRSFIKFSEGVINQIISNALCYIDTFFAQSGFLLGYLHVKKTNDTIIANNPSRNRMMLKQLCVSIITRFMRLTPTYMMVLGIVQLNWTWYDKNTQFYMYERPETCTKYWWRNILYINNLYKTNEMCMMWSWYIASDMQFFIICKALLILSAVYFRTAMSILGILFVGSVAITGYISYTYEHIATIDEILFIYLDTIYHAPWVRISPYIIGVISGYALAKKNAQLNLKRKTITLCWCLASACIISILFALYDRNVSVLFTALYTALSRPLWAISIAWIIIACFSNHGGIANRVLSFKGWIPGSRLSFCAYLLNPLIIYSVYQNSETIVHKDILILLMQGIGIIASTYICSIAMTLMIEMPYNSLLQIFLRSRSTVAPSSSTIKKRL